MAGSICARGDFTPPKAVISREQRRRPARLRERGGHRGARRSRLTAPRAGSTPSDTDASAVVAIGIFVEQVVGLLTSHLVFLSPKLQNAPMVRKFIKTAIAFHAITGREAIKNP